MRPAEQISSADVDVVFNNARHVIKRGHLSFSAFLDLLHVAEVLRAENAGLRFALQTKAPVLEVKFRTPEEKAEFQKFFQASKEETNDVQDQQDQG